MKSNSLLYCSYLSYRCKSLRYHQRCRIIFYPCSPLKLRSSDPDIISYNGSLFDIWKRLGYRAWYHYCIRRTLKQLDVHLGYLTRISYNLILSSKSISLFHVENGRVVGISFQSSLYQNLLPLELQLLHLGLQWADKGNKKKQRSSLKAAYIQQSGNFLDFVVGWILWSSCRMLKW